MNLDRIRLNRAARLLTERLDLLEQRAQEGVESVWPIYESALRTLAALLPHLAPIQGDWLTTAQMAERLGISPKTLLRHKKNKKIRPAIVEGKLLRWRGNEVLDGKADGNATRK